MFPICEPASTCNSFVCNHREEQVHFEGSKLDITQEEGQWLLDQTKIAQPSTKLLYRGSRDGWMKADFHQRCDGHGNLYMFFKFKATQRRAAGFASRKWSSNQEWTFDANSFILSIDKKIVAKADPDSRLQMHAYWGPDFASYSLGLTILGNYRNSMNVYGEANCEKPGYNMPFEDNEKLVCSLSGGRNYPFYHQLDEIEVWQLIE
ncbi:hypothetical protein FGO68_gene10286 [Halteria grandinella]|uniref:TLDc domain-containing protein n=1 Tax=Halteria grandinella TaxID=5974 RepID=A0A8J8NJZ5_HALGN|nr:hypothetical protein FGO68_gene10286 [Halteria grandinella]